MIVAQAPFRHMVTPGGHPMSVAMTNCGSVGWVTDRSGYRYDADDPETGKALAGDAAHSACWPSRRRRKPAFDGFVPDACLVNRYQPGARMSLHQDKDERDFAAPIVSVSLGLPAIFLFGGLKRSDKPRGIRLEHGDIVVWGGPRLFFHGIAPLADGEHALLGRQRINLTFRRRAEASCCLLRTEEGRKRYDALFHQSIPLGLISAGRGPDMSNIRTDRPTPCATSTNRTGLYLVFLQLVFTLGWSFYLIYLPKLAAEVGIALMAVTVLLMLDQAIFTISDTAMGIAADRIARFVGRLGLFVGAVTGLSCAAFVALPYLARTGVHGGQGWFIVLDRDLGHHVVGAAGAAADAARQVSRPIFRSLSRGIGDARLRRGRRGVALSRALYCAIQDPRLPFVISSLVLLLTALALSSVERGAARGNPGLRTARLNPQNR